MKWQRLNIIYCVDLLRYVWGALGLVWCFQGLRLVVCLARLHQMILVRLWVIGRLLLVCFRWLDLG